MNGIGWIMTQARWLARASISPPRASASSSPAFGMVVWVSSRYSSGGNISSQLLPCFSSSLASAFSNSRACMKRTLVFIGCSAEPQSTATIFNFMSSAQGKNSGDGPGCRT